MIQSLSKLRPTVRALALSATWASLNSLQTVEDAAKPLEASTSDG